MEISVQKILETAQEIVPEIDLNLQNDGDMLQFNMVPLNFWHSYFNSMDVACLGLKEKLSVFPDIDIVEEADCLVDDVGCLLGCISIFYSCLLRDLDKFAQSENEREDKLKKFRRSIYRNRPKES
ncbi:hypothetical protein LCGC14_1290560 [marine sediment metagenome]|uniref:Uncharacterized protein n=1 Tax=marine sediment metagenome TaxID=412755 RepID=A0A0F9N974_9ZZZZ